MTTSVRSSLYAMVMQVQYYCVTVSLHECYILQNEAEVLGPAVQSIGCSKHR